MDAICNQPGCNRNVYARGVCKAHYSSLRNKGILTKLPPKIKQICIIEGCGRVQSAKGRCEQHYREFKVSLNPNVYKAVESRRQERHRQRKEQVIALMGGKCVLCGYDKNPACFDFHHLDPTVKEHEPKEILRKPDMDAVMKELSKCILVCKNCHSDIHHPIVKPPLTAP